MSPSSATRLLAASPLAALLAGGAAGAADVCGTPAPLGPTATVVAGPEYAAGGLHRFLLGATYRTLWTEPISVPILDLGGFAGGLTVLEKTGGKETHGLKLAGADGRRYRFRSVHKDASQAPKEALEGVGRAIVADTNSGHYPAAAVVESPLAEAAGIAHATRRLFVMPEDPRLGEFREEFAGVLGTLEEQPRVEAPVTSGFERFRRIEDTKGLLELLDKSPENRVDARAYLKARLFDMLVGDGDRHWKQWDWAERRDDGLWEPIPKDRDRAFARFDGLLASAFGPARILRFGPRYPRVLGLIWSSRDLDRRLLASLDEPVWREVARELQRSLSDAVIAEAACTMPAPYYTRDGAALEAALEARRDRLPELARAFYDAVSREANVVATNAREDVEIRREPGGDVEVSLAAQGQAPYFQRRFHASQTHEVRIYLGGGEDRVVASGHDSGGPTIRIVGASADHVSQEDGGRPHVYRATPADRFMTGPRTDETPDATVDGNGNRPLDWGRSLALGPWLESDPDAGILAGARLREVRYGFRAQPYRASQALSVVYSPSQAGFRARYEGELYERDSRTHAQLSAMFSQVEVVRFYGFGNQTASPGPSQFYLVDSHQYLLAPSWVVPRGAATFSIGPLAKYSDTPLAAGRLIGALAPYGSGGFGELGAQARFEVDTRAPRMAARRGIRLRLAVSAYPAVWSVQKAFEKAHGELAANLPLAGPLSLAMRAGAERVWGRYPFQEAAFLGGSRNVRGIARQRYAGDALAFGNAELRLHCGALPVPIPSQWGLFALADSGRVYLSGESSDRWHTAFGGGLWLAAREGRDVVALSSARSEGRTAVYLRGGLTF